RVRRRLGEVAEGELRLCPVVVEGPQVRVVGVEVDRAVEHADRARRLTGRRQRLAQPEARLGEDGIETDRLLELRDRHVELAAEGEQAAEGEMTARIPGVETDRLGRREMPPVQI